MKPLKLKTSLVNKQTCDFSREELAKYGYDFVKDDLVRALKEAPSRNAVYWAILGLANMNAVDTVPTIKKYVHYPFIDVQAVVVGVVAIFERSAATEFLANQFNEKGFKDKAFLLAPLWEVGDERAVPAMRKYAKGALANIRKIDWGGVGIEYLTEYLEKYNQSSDDDSLIRSLKERAIEERRFKPEDTLFGSIGLLMWPFDWPFRKRKK